MTWQQLLDWTNNPTRTLADLQQGCTALGLNNAGTLDELRDRLRMHIAAQPALTTPATWTAPGWTPPPMPPAPQPAQPATGTRVLVEWVGAGLGLLALLGIIALAVYMVWVRPTTATVNFDPIKEEIAKSNKEVSDKVDGLSKEIGDVKGQVSETDKQVKGVISDVQSLKTKSTTGSEGTTPSTTGTTGSSWTPAQKGEWLRANFPQTTQAVQALGAKLAGVQTQRVRTHLYPVDSVNTVFDGFIVLGPNEGYSGDVTMTVPDHGAIDSYPGATFTGRTKQIGSETIRAYDGKVTGLSMTYWPWDDQNPPLGQSVQPTQPSVAPAQTGNPEGPQALAERMGWKVMEWADQKYGGLRVELSSNSQLPDKWEAMSSGRAIKESDTDRTMVAGVWTIYPPFADREKLGFSK